MQGFARSFFQRFFRPSPQVATRLKSTTTGTAAISMALYSSTVAKKPGWGPVPEDAAAKPHHIKGKNGEFVRFQNPHESWSMANPWRMFSAFFWGQISGEFRPNTDPPTVNVVTPDLLKERTGSGNLRATWLGHACYYVEFPSGLRVLFDPVFEDRCSPVQYAGPKRYTQPPCKLKDLPFVDAVVISHSHYDHLSHTSVLEVQKHHPDVHYFVGQGLAKWFKDSGLNNVTELDWWEDAEFTLTPKSPAKAGSGAPASAGTITARISCLPCQHTSGRSATRGDLDKTLWCSWAVTSGDDSNKKSVWFGGDTGYRTVPHIPDNVDDRGPDFEKLPVCPQFKQIGDLRGPFDLGLIPIGAYRPRWMFSPMHANPFDSVDIFVDTKCKRAMGIHWGTWVLTSEEVLEPPRLLKEAMKRKGLEENGVFDVCEIGETREF